ncbi:MAG: hypothetical protein M1821_007138 [Bathelium mastoideum]|nr:MAG: hypothetical protein M1821_007138 [Bathelium mastoideum]KAI9694648.1 MAG: hypothetical protein M1822_000264 [Bathelium mastoideum]
MLQTVHNWLSHSFHSRWIMIVDNADDADLFFHSENPHSRPSYRDEHRLAEYLPQCTHGAILFTTRDQHAGAELAFHQDLVKVDRMSEVEANGLLLRFFRTSYPLQDISLLAKRLEYLPLAMVQAASYIQRPEMDISKYLNLLESRPVELLNKPASAVGGLPEVPHALASSWLITFKYLRLHHYIAAKLFAFMSFLDAQGIPRSIFTKSGRSPLELEEAFSTLVSFSLITPRLEDRSDEHQGSVANSDLSEQRYDMHPLVRVVTQGWIESENQVQLMLDDLLTIFFKAYPKDFETPYWNKLDLYEPHATAVLERLSQSQDKTTLINFLVKRSRLLHSARRPLGAISGFEQASELAQQFYGSEHPETFSITFELILVRLDFTDPWESFRLVNQTMRKVLMMKSASSAVMENGVIALAECNRKVNCHYEAMLLTTYLLDREKAEQETDGPATLALENCIVLDLINLRNFEKMELFLKQQLQERRRRLGENHWATMYTTDRLWMIYYYTDRGAEADALASKNLRLSEETYGREHPLTFGYKVGVARVYADQGRFEAAAALLESSNAGHIQTYGLYDRRVPSIKILLAIMYLMQDRDEEALESGIEALELLRQFSEETSFPVRLYSWRLEQWRDEASRATYKRAWYEGSNDQREALGKPFYSHEVGLPQAPPMKSRVQWFTDNDELIDALLRGHMRSAFSLHVFGTVGSLRRNARQLLERHPEFWPKQLKEKQPWVSDAVRFLKSIRPCRPRWQPPYMYRYPVAIWDGRST